jgi:aromatic ring-opening dioxygenase catalytic subunit (LigB family)
MLHEAASSLQGTLEKIIIKPMIPGEVEKVQISIQSGDDPNQRIRIANTLIDARGEAVPLKRGAAVHIVIRPKPKDTT